MGEAAASELESEEEEELCVCFLLSSKEEVIPGEVTGGERGAVDEAEILDVGDGGEGTSP